MSCTSSTNAPEVAVATLREGQALDGLFACVRKERQVSKAGRPYLTVELRDSTGAIVGRAFKDADVLGGRFERGEIVRVKGRVERFRDELQVQLREIERHTPAEGELKRFLPSSRQDLDELEGFLEHLVREIYDDELRMLCERLLRDEQLHEGLRIAPCGLPGEGGGRVRKHHSYLGGLLEHTVSVATLAVDLCAIHPRIDRDLLLCAAITHDLGKTAEFSYGAEIARTLEGKMLGHVQLGLRLIAAHAQRTLGTSRLLSLEHCVAMHHGGEGPGEAGFASAEAVALYRINALDAQVKAALERGSQ